MSDAEHQEVGVGVSVGVASAGFSPRGFFGFFGSFGFGLAASQSGSCAPAVGAATTVSG